MWYIQQVENKIKSFLFYEIGCSWLFQVLLFSNHIAFIAFHVVHNFIDCDMVLAWSFSWKLYPQQVCRNKSVQMNRNNEIGRLVEFCS